MANLRFFADFGSTFTKLVAFDMDKEELAARVQAPSSVDTDVMIGLRSAFAEMAKLLPVSEEHIRNTIACSSAAGGLRMVCIGLVPDYTTEAGRLAALGAGAKVIGEYSFELSDLEMREIVAKKADMILLTGGTDGGNQEVIIHNARMLAAYPSCADHIVVAGNCKANDTIKEIFKDSGRSVHFSENVMPKLREVNFEPVNEVIREIFIHHITEAKGIARVNESIAGVVMPTPSAVFEAAKLISNGIAGHTYGMGALLLVDVGGATTDVYSVASGRPSRDGIEVVGLMEPFAKRTVEGDLGLFFNLETLADLAKQKRLTSSEEATDAVESLRSTRSIPMEGPQKEKQLMFTHLAVKTAVERHCGVLETKYTPQGVAYLQHGKDLSEVKCVIGAGGPVSFSADPRQALAGAAYDEILPHILKPKEARFFIDSKYILFAIGLLARDSPEAALRIVKKYLVEV